MISTYFIQLLINDINKNLVLHLWKAIICLKLLYIVICNNVCQSFHFQKYSDLVCTKSTERIMCNLSYIMSTDIHVFKDLKCIINRRAKSCVTFMLLNWRDLYIKGCTPYAIIYPIWYIWHKHFQGAGFKSDGVIGKCTRFTKSRFSKNST